MISKRLEFLCELTPLKNTKGLVDVGCDHGYFLINLYQKGYKGKLLGVENKKGPFNQFINNLKKTKTEHEILASFSDGIDVIDNSYNFIVLAGMGFDNIVKIIDKNKEKLDFIDYILVDSHTKTSEIRFYFYNLGFLIENEILLYENDIYYQIILFTKGYKKYTDFELKYGPILLTKYKNQLLKMYNNEIQKLEQTIERYNILNNDSYKISLKLQEYKKLVNYLSN